jgi:hypothetical protein
MHMVIPFILTTAAYIGVMVIRIKKHDLPMLWHDPVRAILLLGMAAEAAAMVKG